MLIFHDPVCAEYGSSMRPEQPARVQRSVAYLKVKHPEWEWRLPGLADPPMLTLAHTEALLKRLQRPPDFDDDTPYFESIFDHARRSAGAALAASEAAWAEKRPAFSLMRPPGHHATQNQAMGFCYLNAIAIAALHLRQTGRTRVAVWDFDAHHGNGTEAILRGKEGLLFSSVHQYPGYPGTGRTSVENCRNYPVAPRTPREEHLRILRVSWEDVLQFRPEIVLVSAGFDAYAEDPITSMTLEASDFAELGRWLCDAPFPCAAVLEGGYSPDLPVLIDSFLTTWAERVF